MIKTSACESSVSRSPQKYATITLVCNSLVIGPTWNLKLKKVDFWQQQHCRCTWCNYFLSSKGVFVNAQASSHFSFLSPSFYQNLYSTKTYSYTLRVKVRLKCTTSLTIFTEAKYKGLRGKQNLSCQNFKKQHAYERHMLYSYKTNKAASRGMDNHPFIKNGLQGKNIILVNKANKDEDQNPWIPNILNVLKIHIKIIP